MSEVSLDQLNAARRDAAVFAELLLGVPLWDHQVDVVRSPARYRVVCAGRQVGKSRLLAVMALHRAFAVPGSMVLIVSAGDTAAKRLLEDVAAMALGAPLLAGSVVDDSSKAVSLSNGSTVRAVPASTAQIRGWSVDLLIIDEAAFIEPEIWRAAEPAIIARPGARVLLMSSPWGGPDHFFRALWTRAQGGATGELEAWHWPSGVSPLVDDVLLEAIRERETAAYFEREYEAKWTDSAGAYFTMAELDAATDDAADLLTLDDDLDALRALGWVVGGVDWGMARDAHALTVVGGLAEPDGRGRPRFRVAVVEERFRLSYEAWIDRLVEAVERLQVQVLVAETNGVGQMPTQVLARRVWEATGRDLVTPVATTARLKEDLFGFAKLLMQQGRLVLPRHPSLLRQLGALEFTALDGGGMRIAVPERAGHDDVAMSFALALQPLVAGELVPVVDRIVTEDDLFDDEVDGLGIAPYGGALW